MAAEPNKVIYTMIRVSKYYDKKPILKDISLSYFYGAKIGVLGLNGSGKSSLLRILAGVDPDFNGQTILSSGYTVGFLEQEPLLDDTRTVKEIVEQGPRPPSTCSTSSTGSTSNLPNPCPTRKWTSSSSLLSGFVF